MNARTEQNIAEIRAMIGEPMTTLFVESVRLIADLQERNDRLEARLTALERRPVSSYRPLSWGVQVGKRGAGKVVSKLGWGVCS